MTNNIRITQPDIYILELDSHCIRVLDAAICALKSKHKGDLLRYLGKSEFDKLEAMHSEILRVLKDGNA